VTTDRIKDLVNDHIKLIGLGLRHIPQRPQPKRQERANRSSQPGCTLTAAGHCFARSRVLLPAVSMSHCASLSDLFLPRLEYRP
jgi:hypothetical protein